MLLQILLALSVVANLRAFYLLGKQYRFKSKDIPKVKYQEVSLEPENKMFDINKDE